MTLTAESSSSAYLPPKPPESTSINSGPKLTGRQKWTEEETAYMQRNYPEANDVALAACLGRSVMSVKAYALKLGLRKNPAVAKENHTRAMQNRRLDDELRVDDPKVYNEGLLYAHRALVIKELDKIKGPRLPAAMRIAKTYNVTSDVVMRLYNRSKL